MISEESVYQEINKFVGDRINSGLTTPVNWIVHEFLASRTDVHGEDAPLYQTCTRSHLNKLAKEVARKYKADKRDSPDPQTVLPGFKYLQRAYTVTRDEKVVLVPLHLLTDEEMMERAMELDQMAEGCRTHALEIRQFVISRANEAVA